MTAHAQRRRERSLPQADGGSVRLHIGHLVLQGVAPVDTSRVAGALQAELAGLAGQPGTQFTPMAADRLSAAPIATGRIPEQTGRSVASAVWSSIGQGARRQ
jgi:hypothetical protein